MAIQQFTYGNASLGKKITISYDDVAHSITDGVLLPGTIAPYIPLSAGALIQEVAGVGYVYRIRVQNTYPYAYVQTVETECGVEITSVLSSPASTNESSDGSIVVSATGNGNKSYRIDELGSSFQSSNTFTNLAPGTYHITVKNVNNQGFDTFICYDTDVTTVEYEDVVCNLQLGTIEVIKANGGSDGEINVQTVVDPIGLELEYRLDSGAWQSSGSFVGLSAGTYNVQVRYKDFPTCQDSRNVDLFNDVTCDVRITGVVRTFETFKYADDASILVSATSSNGPIQYSIDNGDTYQESNLFSGLSSGTYLVRVQDAEGCEDFLEVVIPRFKSPFIEFPIAQSLRVVPISGGQFNTSRQNFDNRLFKDMKIPGIEFCNYLDKRTIDESTVVQFRGNYSVNQATVKNLSDDSLVASLVATKKAEFTNFSDERSALFADAGLGEVQIFFDTEFPTFFEVGMETVISDIPGLNGIYEIKDIRPGALQAEGYQVLIIHASWPGGTILNGNLETVYDVEPFDVYEVTIPWGLYGPGKYYIEFTGTDEQFEVPYLAKTEPTEVRTTITDLLKVTWRNVENDFKIYYSTGIENQIWIDGVLGWPEPGGERTVMEDSNRRLIKLQEYVSRNPVLQVYDSPFYVLEKLAIIMAHDYKAIDDVQYETQEDFEPEFFQNDPLGNGKCKLRQVDFIAENTHDAGANDVDVTLLEVNGQLLSVNP